MRLKINNFNPSFQKIHLAGQYLCLAILLLPLMRVFLYPNTVGSLSYYAFNGLVGFLEITFISIFILTRRKYSYSLNIFHPILWVGFVIWLIVIILTIPDIANPLDGKTITSQFLIHFIFFVTLSSYIKHQPDAGPLFLYTLLSAFLIFVPAFLINLYLTHDQPGFDWTWSLPGFENVRHLDYFLANIITVFGLLPLYLGQEKMPKKYKFGLIVILIISWVMIFWSGGRGSALAAIFTLTFLLVYFRPDKWIYLTLMSYFTMITGALLSLLLSAPNESYGLFRFYTKIADVDNIAAFSAGRTVIWMESLKVWQENPWLGIGAGQTKTVITSALGVLSQPHNVILQALLAWGIIGGIPFITAIFTPLILQGRALRSNRKSLYTIQFMTYGLVLCTALNAMVDGTLYYPFPLFLFIIGLAITNISPYKSI